VIHLIDPLLFCNNIQPLLNFLALKKILGYLDDVTLGGTVDISSDVAEIAKVGGDI